MSFFLFRSIFHSHSTVPNPYGKSLLDVDLYNILLGAFGPQQSLLECMLTCSDN